MKADHLANAIDAKAPGAARSGKELNTWVTIDGQRKFRITLPKGHSADMKKGTLNAIRKSMRLTWEQLEDFVKCKMSAKEYEALLRQLMNDGQL